MGPSCIQRWRHLYRSLHRPKIQSYLMDYEQSGPLLQSARQSFVKKVYSVISLQLVLTVLTVYFSINSKRFARFLIQNTWPFWLSLIGGIVTLVALCFANISRRVPVNYLVMGVFTMCESLLVAYACQGYDPSSVMLAAVATVAATLGLTYYAMTTKEDFTSGSYIGKGAFYSLIWIVSTVSFLNFFFMRSGVVAYGLAIGFAFIYSFYMLVDTQMILGNKEKRIQLDDYIMGATILYMDIISLFLKLLRILGKKKDD